MCAEGVVEGGGVGGCGVEGVEVDVCYGCCV